MSAARLREKADDRRAARGGGGATAALAARAAPAGPSARAKKPRSAVEASARADDVGERPPAARERRALQGAAFEAEIERAQGIEPEPPRPRSSTPARRSPQPTSAAPTIQSASGRHSRWASEPERPEDEAPAGRNRASGHFGALEAPPRSPPPARHNGPHRSPFARGRPFGRPPCPCLTARPWWRERARPASGRLQARRQARAPRP